MNEINESSIKKAAIISVVFLIVICACAIVVINNLSADLIAVAIMTAMSISLIIMTGMDRYLPLPYKLKKTILMNCILKLALILGKFIKADTENIIKYFVSINNRLNPDMKGKKFLLLLPRCVQYAECGKDLSEDIYTCVRCGKCQVADIIKATDGIDIHMCLVGGGALAVEKIKEIKPDGVIAVACEKELLEGIKEVIKIPVWAIMNLRPNGPCKNTVIKLEEFENILKKTASNH
jgi:hypothetical protein